MGTASEGGSTAYPAPACRHLTLQRCVMGPLVYYRCANPDCGMDFKAPEPLIIEIRSH